jgi:hypothetical protein
MIPLKLRMKMLNKLAQTVPGAPASPASPTSPTSPNAPTEPVSTTAAVIQPPPSFTAASGPWAWLSNSYNAPTVGFLSTILSMIHTVMHYTTEGKHNLVRDQNGLGSLDASGASSSDGKNAIKLAQLIYKTFLNNGQAFAPTAADIHRWASMVENSPPLIEMSQLNPTGPAARQMQLPSSFRQTIVNNLGYIKQYNPLQPQNPQ